MKGTRASEEAVGTKGRSLGWKHQPARALSKVQYIVLSKQADDENNKSRKMIRH